MGSEEDYYVDSHFEVNILLLFNFCNYISLNVVFPNVLLIAPVNNFFFSLRRCQ